MNDSETSGAEPSPHAPSGLWRILPWILAAAATGVGAAAWLLPEVDGADLWWHMAAGRWVWTHGAVPLQDTFTHTEFGQDWADHEWLWGVLAWLSYEVHPALVAWLNLGVATLVFACVGARAFALSRSWAAACLATWCAAAAAHWFIDVRPHLFTLLFTALYLLTLRARWAPLLWPPVMFFWVNLHGGFIFGVGLVGLHALVETLRRRRAGERPDVMCWAGVLATIAVVGCNPWGYAMLLEPFEHLRGDTPFAQLLEWVPLDWSLDPTTYAGRFSWLLGLTLLGAWGSRRDATALLLVALTVLMTTQARRFVPLFAVVAAPVAAVGIAPLFEELERRIPRPAFAPAAGAAALLVVSLFFWNGVRFLPQPLERWTLFESAPTGAVQYLATMEDPPQRLFNSYHWGGYVSFFAPDIHTFIDGRATTLYSDETVADYQTLEEVGPGWRRLLRKHRIGAVLVARPSPLAEALAQEDPPWKRVDTDPRSFLFFPPWREDLVAYEDLLGDGADLYLARAFRQRLRRNFDAAERNVEEVLQRFPLQLYAHGEGMMVAAKQSDPEGIERWAEAARRAYPRRRDLIASFEERAWRTIGDWERAARALESMKLGGPFVTEAHRERIASLIAALRGMAEEERAVEAP
jgi:hypothetical protein